MSPFNKINLKKLFAEDDRLREECDRTSYRARELVTKKEVGLSPTERKRFDDWYAQERAAASTMDPDTLKKWNDWVDARINRALNEKTEEGNIAFKAVAEDIEQLARETSEAFDDEHTLTRGVMNKIIIRLCELKKEINELKKGKS